MIFSYQNRYLIYTPYVDWVNFDSLKLFAEKLCAENPRAKSIHLILDNAGYHKIKDFTDFIKSTKIKIHYLLPYSPNLNPIERRWNAPCVSIDVAFIKNIRGRTEASNDQAIRRA